MQYYVIGPDGSKYGPADVATLQQWVVENRLGPTSMLEDFGSGQRVMASSVPGLMPGVQPMAPTPTPGLYSQPTANYPRMAGNSGGGSSELTTSFVLTALSFVCCPVILPILGLVYANKAMDAGNTSASGARIFAIVVLVIQSLGVLAYVAMIVALIVSGGSL